MSDEDGTRAMSGNQLWSCCPHCVRGVRRRARARARLDLMSPLATLLDGTGRSWTNGETERESNPDSCMADLKQDLESHLSRRATLGSASCACAPSISAHPSAGGLNKWVASHWTTKAFPSILPRKGGLIPVRNKDQKVGADLQILHSPATHALSFFARRPAHDWATAPGESEYADV